MNREQLKATTERNPQNRSASAKAAFTDEHLLVTQAQMGHASAFGELYERHHLTIYRSVLRILQNSHDAEDALQQSFQHAFTNLARFRGDSTFATWVTRIAINEALTILRRRRLITVPIECENEDGNTTAPIDPADDRPTPEQALFESESRAVLTHAISQLQKSLRTVALLRVMHGLSNAETARRLGLTVTAVKTRNFRARCCLRKCLEAKYATGCGKCAEQHE